MSLDYTYTRTSIIDALNKLNRPSSSNELYAKWMEISNIEKIWEIEAVPVKDRQDLNLLNIIFSGAMMELIKSKELYANDIGEVCLIAWKPEIAIRSIDDNWES